MSKITWADKVTLDAQPDIARINKVIDEDMNEIKSAVNDNDNNITNITGTILWTNPNPTSEFPAQTITLDSDDYDILEIFYQQGNTDNRQIGSARILKGADARIITLYSGSIINRDLERNSNTSYSIGNSTGTNVSTTSLIPLYIVGYKTGLFNV